ncbi:hypothetical protein BSL78_12908 [Apostichopus japonicus]|uniref:Uncharacterized protein n=1 Tax=Stichopus japonicus TaxID=307972 RepID=A0A2G8KQB6_STIJA|nr:hypothetical protein BSL78_12908 [Apostichopus japonicus]
MNVSDEQLHQTEECEHQTRECESSCKQDETNIRDGAYSSNDANILKSSKDMKMALKLVKLGLIETTSDFEEYKCKLLMDEVQRREFSLKEARTANTEMISPQVIICPCSASHFQPQTRLPPHRCSRCYLMCSEPVTYGDKIEIPADKAKSSYTTNFDVPSRKVTEKVEEPIFRTKMFGLTGIPSEDKKVWQKFCRHILSGFSEDNKIGQLPGLTTPAFQSNFSSKSAAFMKPTVTTMVQNDTNHSLLHKAKPTNTEETLSTMTDSLSAINSEDVCAGHIQEIQAQNKKIQKLETQLEELRREMKLEQVQKESELVRIRSQRQYDREVFHRKLRQAKENAEVTHKSYQFAVDEEQEDLDIISLSVSDNETFNMGLKSKSLRETVTQVSDPNQIERDTLYSSTKTFRRGFQIAQTDGRAKDSKNNEWNLKNEEISTFKSNGDKLQEMLEQHKQRLQDANTSKLSREDKFKGALIGQSESYAKISHLVIDDQSLQNDHLNETSTVEALTASLDILKRDNTELKSESEVKDKEIWELKKERLDLKDRVFQLDRELFDTQDKLIKKSAVITDLEKTKQFLDNKVIQLAEQQRENNIILSRKNQLLLEGKRSGNDLREKIERLEDHLRFRCRINNNLRDDKVLLEKKLALLECQYNCAWNEHDGSYDMMKRKLGTSSSERI